MAVGHSVWDEQSWLNQVSFGLALGIGKEGLELVQIRAPSASDGMQLWHRDARIRSIRQMQIQQCLPHTRPVAPKC